MLSLLNTGGRYNPGSDSWTATVRYAPSPRRDLKTTKWSRQQRGDSGLISTAKDTIWERTAPMTNAPLPATVRQPVAAKIGAVPSP